MQERAHEVGEVQPACVGKASGISHLLLGHAYVELPRMLLQRASCLPRGRVSRTFRRAGARGSPAEHSRASGEACKGGAGTGMIFPVSMTTALLDRAARRSPARAVVKSYSGYCVHGIGLLLRYSSGIVSVCFLMRWLAYEHLVFELTILPFL